MTTITPATDQQPFVITEEILVRLARDGVRVAD
jgi:hypothetical protein